MITFANSLSGTYFSSTMPDVEFSISGIKAAVTMAIDGEDIYAENLFPASDKITISDISNLITPYIRAKLVAQLTISITDIDSNDTATASASVSAKIVFCNADFSGADVESFCNAHFLSILLGSKITAQGRLEFLHYVGTDKAVVSACYADGSTTDFTPPTVQGNDKYTTIDISPSRFVTEGKTLTDYTVTAGARSQHYDIDLEQPDCAPCLIFENSFGCEELIYCTGKHQVSPEYKRDTANIGGKTKNYRVTETRTFKADTGYLTVPMQNWADELFRSDCVRIVNFYGREPNIGKEVTITDSKSETSNMDDEMARFTFSYQYSQLNQNIVDLKRAGRIFDNTFDFTFN